MEEKNLIKGSVSKGEDRATRLVPGSDNQPQDYRDGAQMHGRGRWE
jgi:hypothetical protein